MQKRHYVEPLGRICRRRSFGKCTLYTNFEPCAMCAGSIYWANIGCVVYGCAEEKLLELTGNDAENMTLNLSCRTVFKSGQKDIRVFGPVEEVEQEVYYFFNYPPNDRFSQTILRSGKGIRNQLKKPLKSMIPKTCEGSSVLLYRSNH